MGSSAGFQEGALQPMLFPAWAPGEAPPGSLWLQRHLQARSSSRALFPPSCLCGFSFCLILRQKENHRLFCEPMKVGGWSRDPMPPSGPCLGVASSFTWKLPAFPGSQWEWFKCSPHTWAISQESWEQGTSCKCIGEETGTGFVTKTPVISGSLPVLCLHWPHGFLFPPLRDDHGEDSGREWSSQPQASCGGSLTSIIVPVQINSVTHPWSLWQRPPIAL